MLRRIQAATLPDGRVQDLLIEDGFIREIADSIFADCETIDAGGLTLLPALTDLHVHLRDPGQTHKEDILTAAAAAVAGGVTALFAMPNTTPACDTPETVDYVLQKAAQTGIDMIPAAAVTKGLKGEELTDLTALRRAGATVMSDDGRPVATSQLLEECLRLSQQLDMPLFAHCEDLKLAGNGILHLGEVSRQLGVEGLSSRSEWEGIAREIDAVRRVGGRLHICHVSTRESVEVIRRAKEEGLSVTAETAPHYFVLTHQMLLKRDADYRMNPPLREQEDVDAIIRGLQDGTLDAIATDHAPHAPEEKADFISAPNGVVGLETSLAAALTYLVQPGLLSLDRVVELMSTRPRMIGGLPEIRIAAGEKANLILVDLQEGWTVQPERLHSKSRNSCFKGLPLRGKVKYTIKDDAVLFRDGI